MKIEEYFEGEFSGGQCNLRELQREFEGAFKGILRVFQANFKDVRRNFLGCFNDD